MDNQIADFVADKEFAPLRQIRISRFHLFQEIRNVVNAPHQPFYKSIAEKSEQKHHQKRNRRDDSDGVAFDI